MRANPQPERRIQVTSPGAGWSRANRRGAVPRGDVLVATWGGGGNLPPLLSVGQLLVLNGHRVRVLASGATRRAAEQAGFETVPYRCSQDPEMTVAFESQAARLLATMAGPEIAADVRYWLSELNPGLFVADCMLPAALTAAQVAGTPAVSVVHFLYGPARRHMIATGRGGMVDVPQLNLTRGALGLPVVAHPLEAWEAADLVLVTAPRWFDLDGSPPAHVVHAGPLGVHRKPAPTTGRRSGRPLVLISFSTTVMDRQSEVVQAVCSGCAELGVDALVTLGPAIDARSLHATANVAIVPFANHDEVIPGCAAVITHGGLGTSLRSLAHGVPQLLLPLGRDQHVNAARVADLGAGIVLPANSPPARIGTALEAVLREERFQAAAAHAAVRIAADDPDRTAVTALEQAAHPRRRAVHGL